MKVGLVLIVGILGWCSAAVAELPSVSIVMINTKASWAEVALEQVKEQVYDGDIEVVFIDTDNISEETVNGYPGKKSYLSNKKMVSLGESRNQGVGLSTGRIVMLWDVRDYHSPLRIANQVSAMIARNSSVVLLPFDYWFDVEDKHMYRIDSPKQNFESLAFERSLWKRGVLEFPKNSQVDNIPAFLENALGWTRGKYGMVSNKMTSVYVADSSSRMVPTFPLRVVSKRVESPPSFPLELYSTMEWSSDRSRSPKESRVIGKYDLGTFDVSDHDFDFSFVSRAVSVDIDLSCPLCTDSTEEDLEICKNFRTTEFQRIVHFKNALAKCTQNLDISERVRKDVNKRYKLVLQTLEDCYIEDCSSKKEVSLEKRFSENIQLDLPLAVQYCCENLAEERQRTQRLKDDLEYCESAQGQCNLGLQTTHQYQENRIVLDFVLHLEDEMNALCNNERAC